MLETYSIVKVDCDCVICDKDKCWQQSMVKVEKDELESDALDFLTELGWEINDEETICPYCNKGIINNELEEEDV